MFTGVLHSLESEQDQSWLFYNSHKVVSCCCPWCLFGTELTHIFWTWEWLQMEQKKLKNIQLVLNLFGFAPHLSTPSELQSTLNNRINCLEMSHKAVIIQDGLYMHWAVRWVAVYCTSIPFGVLFVFVLFFLPVSTIWHIHTWEICCNWYFLLRSGYHELSFVLFKSWDLQFNLLRGCGYVWNEDIVNSLLLL